MRFLDILIPAEKYCERCSTSVMETLEVGVARVRVVRDAGICLNLITPDLETAVDKAELSV